MSGVATTILLLATAIAHAVPCHLLPYETATSAFGISSNHHHHQYGCKSDNGEIPAAKLVSHGARVPVKPAWCLNLRNPIANTGLFTPYSGDLGHECWTETGDI